MNLAQKTGHPSQNRFVSLVSVIAIFCCLATTYLAVNAGSFEYEASGNPAGQITIGLNGVPDLKWMMICDMFGFYWPTIPAGIYLWSWLRGTPRSYTLNLATVSGLFYALVGSIGAAILSVAWPELTIAYAKTSELDAKNLAVELFKLVSAIVQEGIWGRLEYFLAAIWYIGLGMAAWPYMRGFSGWSILTGLCAAVSSFGKIMGYDELAGWGLYGILVTVPVWFGWVGLMAWKGSISVDADLDQPIEREQRWPRVVG